MTVMVPSNLLQTQFKALRRLDVLLFCLALAALILCFVSTAAAIAVLGVSLLLKITLGRKLLRDYQSGMIHARALLTLQRYLKDSEHTHEPVLSRQEIRQTRMLPCNAASGSILCCEGAHGTYRGRAVRLGDVTVTHTFTQNNKKSHSSAVGCWVTVELGEDTGLDCRFLGESVVPAQSLKEMLWVETDLKQTGVPLLLHAGWSVLCAEDSPAMPGERFLKQLEELHTKTGGKVAVCVRQRQLHLFLSGDILGQQVSRRIPPEQLLQNVNLLPNLSWALALSDAL